MLKSLYIDPPKGDTKTIRAALAALPLYGFEVHSQRQHRTQKSAAVIKVRCCCPSLFELAMNEFCKVMPEGTVILFLAIHEEVAFMPGDEVRCIDSSDYEAYLTCGTTSLAAK